MAIISPPPTPPVTVATTRPCSAAHAPPKSPARPAPAASIATPVAMLAAGAGLAGLFGGAWAAEQGLVVATLTGAVGGGLMMAITCMMVNFVYVFGMGIPAASGKVAKDPITGDTQAEFKSQGTCLLYTS